jgi:hypothetical protein
MTRNKIGIKLANGEFYPILEEGVPAKKRLTVTTVKDRQKSVQIDLFRGQGPSVLDAEYVGSLVVERIPQAPGGEPDLRLEIELDAGGILKAMVREPVSGEEQILSVSLEDLGEEKKYELPDFDLEEERTDNLPEDEGPSGGAALNDAEVPSDELTSPEEGAGLLASATEYRGKGRSPWVFVIAIVVILFGLTLAWFIYQGGFRPNLASGPTSTSAPAEKPAIAPPPSAAPVAAVAAPAPVAPVPAAGSASTAVVRPAPETPAPSIPSGGKRYKIRWGDTLWDLAWVYYRDPWLYPRIAKANRIRNPDIILAGSSITIPPR